MFCEQCGRGIAPGSKFCTHCGAPAPVEPPAPEQEAPVSEVAPEPVVEATPEQTPVFEPAPEPVVEPSFAAVPDLEPAPTFALEPEPTPTFTPEPEPAPVFTPEPEPEPAPAPVYAPPPPPPPSYAAPVSYPAQAPFPQPTRVPPSSPAISAGAEKVFGTILILLAILGFILGFGVYNFLPQLTYDIKMPFIALFFLELFTTIWVPLAFGALALVGLRFATGLKRRNIPSSWFRSTALADIIIAAALIFDCLLNALTFAMVFGMSATQQLLNTLDILSLAVVFIAAIVAVIIYFVTSGKARELPNARAGLNIISGITLLLFVLYAAFRFFFQGPFVNLLIDSLNLSYSLISPLYTVFFAISGLLVCVFFIMRGAFWSGASKKV